MFLLRLMNRFMLLHSRLSWETFRAKRAEKWSGAVVVLPQSVCSQRIARIEGLVTLFTLEGSHSAVDPHVGPQGGLLAEGLATCVADEGFVPGVSPDVILELEHLLEIFPTERADPLPLLVLQQEMSFSVSFQFCLGHELSPALRAGESCLLLSLDFTPFILLFSSIFTLLDGFLFNDEGTFLF